jgi:hypothetical protein
MTSILHQIRRLKTIIVLLMTLALCGCGKHQEDNQSNKPVVWRLNPSPGCIIEAGGFGGPDGIRREVHILIGVQNDSEVELSIDSVIVFDSVRTNVLPSTFEGLSAALTYPTDSFNFECRSIPPKSWRMGRALCYRPESRLYLRTLGVQVYTNHGNVTELLDSLFAFPERPRAVPVRARDASTTEGLVAS